MTGERPSFVHSNSVVPARLSESPMTCFLQLHILTSHAPANLNRDDTGRPKTALVGGSPRLRISSQSAKRAWRTSETFESSLAGAIGTRTRRLGHDIHAAFVAAGIADKQAREWSRAIVQTFGKLKSEKKAANDEDLEIEQLAHLSPEEMQAVDALTREIAGRKTAPTADELQLLRHPRRAADIAMFGRMLADSPEYNVEAAVQVAHAFTVHEALVEDDYFSAVDDLQKVGDSGAGHIGERGYGAGLFYQYIAIDRDLLVRNLGGDDALARKTIKALVEAATKVTPTGMQASFASRAYAGYVLAERGSQQPRSLSQAFLQPVRDAGHGMFAAAVHAIRSRRQAFDAVYGACADERCEMNVEADPPEGSLQAITDFLVKDCPA